MAVSREQAILQEGNVALDALVGSARDPRETYHGQLAIPPKLWVSTEGAAGGTAYPGGRYAPAPLPAPARDSYGCGDAFVAALTVALAAGVPDPLAFAAARGALAATRKGVG